MSYVLKSTGTRHNLDGIGPILFEVQDNNLFKMLQEKELKKVTFDLVPMDQAVHYASEDADITYRLHEELKSRLAKEPVLNTPIRRG
ncbi:MAG: hypothetical protein Ct9H300mP3_05840 [Gammaproteobacteria bacterium]|nr:MAG: hypothetical protein Ct9H300mP3_05840 [Gammaproteobacteria bacterium]